MWVPNDWSPDAQPEPDWVKWVGGGPPPPPLERERHLQLELCKINTLTLGPHAK